MTKLLALTFVLCFLVAIHVLVMMYGWGLTPVSWWWIIGGGVFAQIAGKAMLDAVMKTP